MPRLGQYVHQTEGSALTSRILLQPSLHVLSVFQFHSSFISQAKTQNWLVFSNTDS